MKMISKIKSIFKSQTLLERIAAICDTNVIENNQKKMDLLQRLLNREGIQTGVLGGATNRYVVTIEGYAVKIAVDEQGYKDNLMEFALTHRMAHTPNSYETNGYVLCQKAGRPVTQEEWQVRKYEILRILDELGQDWLLGDVGYTDVNFTNWIVNDSGELEICDYAYCHRKTEKLFTCPHCGSVLSYDETSVYILCTDRANCHAKFTYNELKAIQGNEVDWQMINEALKEAVLIPEGQNFVEIDVNNNLATTDKVMYVRNYTDLYIYNKLKEESTMVRLDYSDPEVQSLLRELLIEKALGNEPKIKEIEATLHDLEKPMGRPIECIIDPDFQDIMEQDALDEEEARIYEEAENNKDSDNIDDCFSIDDLINMAVSADDSDEEEYYDEEDPPEPEDEPEQEAEETGEDESEDESDYNRLDIGSEDGVPLEEDVVLDGYSMKAAINPSLVLQEA